MVETSVGMAGTGGQSDQNGNGGRLEKAAESVMLRLVARWMMAVGIPAVIAVLAWGGREIVSATNANTLALVELKGIVAGLRGQIDSNVTILNNRIDAHVDRLKGLEARDRDHDDRMNRQDQKIETIQQKIWQMPGGRSQ